MRSAILPKFIEWDENFSKNSHLLLITAKLFIQQHWKSSTWMITFWCYKLYGKTDLNLVIFAAQWLMSLNELLLLTFHSGFKSSQFDFYFLLHFPQAALYLCLFTRLKDTDVLRKYVIGDSNSVHPYVLELLQSIEFIRLIQLPSFLQQHTNLNYVSYEKKEQKIKAIYSLRGHISI